MGEHSHHEPLIKEVAELLAPLFYSSPQAIYIYLDDTHKTCNQKFSDLLGYPTIEDWIKNPHPLGDVLDSDQEKVVDGFIAASEKYKASMLKISFTTKDGAQVPVNMIMTPYTYKDEVFVLHFIDPS